MPELPEVETTRRGIEPYLRGRRVLRLDLYESRLRWRVADDLPERVRGSRVKDVARRAKYLLLHLEAGTLLVHLGMSGSLRVLRAGAERSKHDHFDLVLDSGDCIRFNDPRRFGSLHLTDAAPDLHPLLRNLAPEPLSEQFTADYLWRVTRGRRVAIKQLLMMSHLVVGVGNIYANEALFRAGIRPRRAARSLRRAEVTKLVRAVRQVLGLALRAGGTTLRDYVRVDGEPGYFRQRLYVYERAGQPCRNCATPIKHLVQQQRSSYYCPSCQH
ncbi:MAG: bifunctional DNA-formamidopyrimidine glycosylase/DNA-(apurinic or apyrimidinic site) lyase [Steroidobacteraceae bacterium]